MNNYIKLFRDLTNVDEMIKNEDKTLILLISLPDEEFEIFALTFNNRKASLIYNDVSATLVDHEVRKKDKLVSSSSTKVEALTAEGSVLIIDRGREMLISPN